MRLEEGCRPSEGLVQVAGYMYGLSTSWEFQTVVGWVTLLPALLEVPDF